jgi:hypothetical protein
MYKRRKRLLHKNQIRNAGLSYALKLQAICSMELPLEILRGLEKEFEALGNYNLTAVFEWQKLLYAVSDGFSYLERYQGEKDLKTILKESKDTLEEHLDRLEQFLLEQQNRTTRSLQHSISSALNTISKQTSFVPANAFISGAPGIEVKRKLNLLSRVPSRWASNQSTLLRSIHVESQLLLFESRLSNTIRELLDEHGRILKKEVLGPVLSFEDSLTSEKDKKIRHSRDILSHLNQTSDKSLQLGFNKVIDRAFRNIKSTLVQLPADAEVFAEDVVNSLSNQQFEDLDKTRIPVFRLVDYRVQNQLFAPMVSSVSELISEIRNSLSGIEDASRLIQLSRDDSQNGSPAVEMDQFESVSAFLEEQKTRIHKNEKAIAEQYDHYRKTVLSNLEKTGSDLHLYRLTKLAESSTLFSKKEAREQMRFLRKQATHLRSFWQKIRADIWYRQSEAHLLARRITRSGDEKSTAINDLLNLKELLSAKPATLDKLPFYYQQLFLSKYNYQPEFWYGHERELNDGKKAIKRYRTGNKGFLVITGQRGSGKSFFAQHLFSRIQQSNMYTLIPPIAGSVEPADFESSLGELVGQKGNADTLLAGLPEGTVIILDDLELWWERSPKGSTMMEWIFGMLQRNYQHLFFVLIANNISYNVIKQLQPFSDYTLQNIELTPFSSKELQEMILFRHRTSGFKLQVDSIMPAGMTQARQARLFNRVFRFSGGNAGTAMHCWIANIKDYHNQTVFMQSPILPDIQIFRVLPAQIKIVLLQFLLHKRLTTEKLSRIMQAKEKDVSYALQYLQRAGLVHQRSEQSYEIDPYMHYHAGQYLMKEYDKSD